MTEPNRDSHDQRERRLQYQRDFMQRKRDMLKAQELKEIEDERDAETQKTPSPAINITPETIPYGHPAMALTVTVFAIFMAIVVLALLLT